MYVIMLLTATGHQQTSKRPLLLNKMRSAEILSWLYILKACVLAYRLFRVQTRRKSTPSLACCSLDVPGLSDIQLTYLKAAKNHLHFKLYSLLLFLSLTILPERNNKQKIWKWFGNAQEALLCGEEKEAEPCRLPGRWSTVNIQPCFPGLRQISQGSCWDCRITVGKTKLQLDFD